MLLSLLVITRIVINPLSNVYQKKLVHNAVNPLFIIFVTHSLLTLSSLILIKNILHSSLPVEYFFYLLLCSIFAVSGNTLLVKALKYGDLSILGPVNSYKSIVGLVFGIFLIGEIPSLAGLSGILLIFLGSYFISDNNKKTSNALIVFFKNKGVQLRIPALILLGIEAVFLKKALTYSSPLITFVLWCLYGFVISGILLLFNTKSFNVLNQFWERKTTFLSLYLTTGIMQLCTLYIFDHMQVGYALALFQISTLLSVFFGWKYFNEKNIRRKLVAAILMAVGSVFIILFGK